MEKTQQPSMGTNKPRVMFLSPGHSPKTRVVAQIFSGLDMEIEALERGALDGLSRQEIATFLARDDEPCVVTYQRDGTAIILSKARLETRLEAILNSFRPGQYDLVVILTTGLMRNFQSTCPTINAQRAMESAIVSFAACGDSIGNILPLKRQCQDLDIPALHLFTVRTTYLEDKSPSSLKRIAAKLGSCDIIVLNSVSFAEEDRLRVAKATGKPTINALNIIIGAMRLFLNQNIITKKTEQRNDFEARLSKLTPREKQVLSLISEGLSNKEAARQLGISPKTVEIHRANVMKKMAVSSVGALIRLVLTASTA